jgi:hypothetical protein
MHETGSGNPYGVQGLRRRGRTPRRRASGTPRARYGTDAGPPARPHDVLGQTRLALDRSDGQQTLRRRSAALLCVRRLRLRQLSRVHSASKRQLTACHLGAHRVDSVLALFSQPHLWGDSAMHALAGTAFDAPCGAAPPCRHEPAASSRLAWRPNSSAGTCIQLPFFRLRPFVPGHRAPALCCGLHSRPLVKSSQRYTIGCQCGLTLFRWKPSDPLTRHPA